MNDDYISREAAKLAVVDAAQSRENGFQWGETVTFTPSEIIGLIDKIPAADVRPVVRAHWMTWEDQFPGRKVPRKSGLGVFCSNPDCRKHADNMTDFCPNCGAKM